jgi:hypothetical protein
MPYHSSRNHKVEELCVLVRIGILRVRVVDDVSEVPELSCFSWQKWQKIALTIARNNLLVHHELDDSL